MDMETLGYFIYMDECERAASQEDEKDSEGEEEEQPAPRFGTLLSRTIPLQYYFESALSIAPLNSALIAEAPKRFPSL